MNVLQQYDEWAAQRTVISGREEAGDYPKPNEWEYSDDTGCDLAHELATQLLIALDIIEALRQPGYEEQTLIDQADNFVKSHRS